VYDTLFTVLFLMVLPFWAAILLPNRYSSTRGLVPVEAASGRSDRSATPLATTYR